MAEDLRDHLPPAPAPARRGKNRRELRYSQDSFAQEQAAQIFGRLAELLSKEMDRRAGGFGSTYFGGHVTPATIFRRLDIDDSGRISTAEWLTVLRRDLKLPLLKFTDEDLWKLYDAIDADGTGWISLKEFADFARKTPYNTEFKHQQMMRQARKPKVVMPKVTKAPAKGPDQIVPPPPELVRAYVTPRQAKPCAGNYTSSGDWSRLWWLPR